MKNKKLIIIVLPIILLIIIFTLLNMLGNKTRIGYIEDITLNIDDTLSINNITNDLIITNNQEFKKEYINTNMYLQNYLYNFRISYYSKVFRNSDIYEVYPNINKIIEANTNIISINIDKKGSPFGKITSYILLYDKKIDNVEYTLKIKSYILKILFLIITFITLIFIFIYLLNIIYKNINNFNFSNYKKITHYNQNNQYINIFIFSFIIVLFLVLIIYQNIVLRYPFNFGWESQAFILDIFLSVNNRMKDVFIWPGITPDILFKYIFIPIGKLFNILNIPTFNDLKQSLNPFFLYKEFVDYIFIVNRAILLIFSIIMYINIINILKPTFHLLNKYLLYIIAIFIAILAFILPSTLTLFFYRPEPSGLLMWSIALFFTIKASKTNSYYYHKLYIILSGLFIGFAYLQKLLFFGGVIIIPLIYFIIKENEFEYKNIYDKKSFLIFVILTSVLIIFNIILYYIIVNKKLIAVNFFILNRKGISNPLTKILIAQLILPIICIFISLFLYMIKIKKIQLPNIVKIYIYYFVIYITSVISSILITLTLPNGIQSLFNGYLFSFAPTQFFLSIISKNIGNNSSIPIIITSIIIFLLLLIPIYKFNIFYSKRRLFFSVLMLLISIFINYVLSRGRLNIHYSGLGVTGLDQLVGFSFIIISIIVLLREALLNIKLKYISVSMFSIIVIIYSYFCFNRMEFVYNKYTEHSSYFYTIKEWITWSYYNLRGTEYVNILKNVYSDDKSINYVIRWSKDIKKVKTLLLSINNNNNLSDTIIAAENQYLDIDKNKQITYIDSKLEGNLIVKLKNDNENKIYLREDYNFYLISKNKCREIDERIIEMPNIQFQINEINYNIYLLTMSDWIKLDYGYNGEFIFDGKELEDSYILIEEK